MPKQGYFTKEYIDSPFFETFLDTQLSQDVKAYAEKHHINFSMVLISAYQALLKRHTDSNNIIVNYSSAVSYTDKKIFGCLENRIPLRVVLPDTVSFQELVTLTKQQLAYDHYYKDIQITDIVKSIRDKCDHRFTGIFSNTSFDNNYLPYDELQLGTATVKLIPKFMKKFVTEDLAIYYRDLGERISLIADFDEHIDSTAVKNFLQHYENQAKKTPDSIALIYENQTLTYRTLNEKANQLANVIIKQLKSDEIDHHDTLVGICLSRGLEMIISMYAIVKAGAAIPEFFAPLLCGATTYILENALRTSGDGLINYIEKNEISHAILPPALLQVLPKRNLNKLKTLAVAGGTCEQSVINYGAHDRYFINAYGPTEATVCATYSVLHSGDPAKRIGKPLPNYTIYVLDNNLNPAPIGVHGELYISGIGLARGYLNRPDLTAEQFLINPFTQERMYRTGDLVRWLSDGNLEYIGRTDHQIKIRGFRVELGEIESVLLKHPKIKETTVIINGEGDAQRLLAYYTSHNNMSVLSDELRKHVQFTLPHYMIPALFITLKTMPLSPNGKIDKKSLPKINIIDTSNNYIAPSTPLEEKLSAILCELFAIPSVSINDNFFELGGNSILSIRLLAKIKSGFNIDINLAKFFKNQQLLAYQTSFSGLIIISISCH